MKNMMTALILENFGDDKFTRTELPIPQPQNGEILVRNYASGVNPIDYKIRLGESTYAMPELPAVLGADVAGVVVGVGNGVTQFSLGDEVYGMIGGVRGLQGSLAEYVAIDAELLAHKPYNLSMREAAALPLAFLTAWKGLVDNANIQSKQSVLVQGGAGGVGSIVVQLARAFGAKVWATGCPDDLGLISELGAIPLDYTEISSDDIIAASPFGQGFDIIYDTVGGLVLDTSIKLIRNYGHVVSCAAAGNHNLTTFSLRAAILSGVNVLLPMISGVGRNHYGKLLNVATSMVEEGKLRPIVDPRLFRLDQAIDAQHAVQDGSATVKVVVNIYNGY